MTKELTNASNLYSYKVQRHLNTIENIPIHKLENLEQYLKQEIFVLLCNLNMKIILKIFLRNQSFDFSLILDSILNQLKT